MYPQIKEIIWCQNQTITQQHIFQRSTLATETNKIRLNTDKLRYLGLSVLEISKIIMCRFGHESKYGDKANLCYIDTDSFTINIKTEDVCKDIANDVEKSLDTSNYETEKRLAIGKNKKGLD